MVESVEDEIVKGRQFWSYSVVLYSTGCGTHPYELSVENMSASVDCPPTCDNEGPRISDQYNIDPTL